MNSRSIMVIVLALVSGISAVVGVNQLRQPASEGIETTPILVVRSNIPRGRMLTADMLESREWPKDFLPANVLTDMDAALGRATISPFIAGEPLLEGKLAAKDSGRGLAALVPMGMRAYTVQTSRVAANVAGFILPGNRVDVLLSLHNNPNDGSGGGSTTTLLQAVEILAVDQRLDAPAENRIDPSDKGSVTLLVSPEQASLLDLGQSMGALTLSLRNLEDTEQSETKPATLADLRQWHDRTTPNLPPTAEHAAVKAASKQYSQDAPVSSIRTFRGRLVGQVSIGR